MPLLGVGIDVVEVARVGRLLDRYGQAFERRWFTPTETRWARRAGCPAAGFSALLAGKEAVWKSLGLDGDGSVPWRSIEVLPDDTGGRVRVPAVLAPDATRVQVDVTLGDRVVMAYALAWSGAPANHPPDLHTRSSPAATVRDAPAAG